MTRTIPLLAADFETQLASAVSVAATTATLVSISDSDSVSLASGIYAFTIDGNKSNKEYILATLSGTALTNIVSISRQGASTSGFVRAHKSGASVKITDWAVLSKIVNNLTGVTNFDSTVNLGYDGAPTGLTGNQFATVAYVLSVVSGGAVTFDQQVISNQLSGEALAINDVVYFKESDQRWYKADADLTTTFDQLQIGINKTTAAGAAVSIQIAISGPVSGFASTLTAGSKYYLSNTAGAITTTPGTFSVFLGWALTTSILLFNPVLKTLPTQKEKDAMAGGGSFGTPSSTNKFLTQEYTASASGLPTVQVYTPTESGSSTTRFDITNPAGTTFRYTWDGTGTDPVISAVTVPIGSVVQIYASSFSAANSGTFTVTGSGANYFEITNASGVAENDKVLGATGFFVKGQIWTKPANLKYVVVEVVGGGGGGAGATVADNGSSGGGGGGYSREILAAASLAATENVTIGHGGIAGIGGATGGNANTSSFGTTPFLQATGGGGGIYSFLASTSTGGVGGIGSGGTINVKGDGGGCGTETVGVQSGKGGATVLGGGAESVFNTAAGSFDGVAGGNYGGGGSGAFTGSSGNDAAGGVGAGGVVIVTEYYA